MVGNGAGRDAQEPRDKRNAAPFELANPGQGFAEDIGSQILGLVAVADAPGDAGVDGVEVLLLQVGKAGGVALGGLDLQLVVMLLAHCCKEHPHGGSKSYGGTDNFRQKPGALWSGIGSVVRADRKVGGRAEALAPRTKTTGDKIAGVTNIALSFGG